VQLGTLKKIKIATHVSERERFSEVHPQ